MANQNVNVNFRGTDDISAKIERLEKRFSDLNKRLKNTSRRGKEVGDNFKKMKRDSDGLSRSLKRVGGILAGAFAIRTVKNAVDLGVAVKDVRQQFELLVRNNRGNPNTFLAQLRRTAQGTISDFGLLQAAAQGLGRSLSLSEVNAAVGASITIAAQQGKSAATALEEIISAMITLSAQRLDNIGITPAQLRGLDDAQKKLVVIQRLQELALQAPSIQANQAYKQLNAQLENLRNNLSAALVSSRAFGRIVERLNEFFTPERVNKWANAVERGIDALLDFGDKHPTLVKALAAGVAINFATGGAVPRAGLTLGERAAEGAARGLGQFFSGAAAGIGFQKGPDFAARVLLRIQTTLDDIFKNIKQWIRGPLNRFSIMNRQQVPRVDRAIFDLYQRFVGNNERIAKTMQLKIGGKEGTDLLNVRVAKLRTLRALFAEIGPSLIVIAAFIESLRGTKVLADYLKSKGKSLKDFQTALIDIVDGLFEIPRRFISAVLKSMKETFEDLAGVFADLLGSIKVRLIEIPEVKYVLGMIKLFVPKFTEFFADLGSIFDNLYKGIAILPFLIRDQLRKVPIIGDRINERIEGREREAIERNALASVDAEEYLAGLLTEFGVVDKLVNAPSKKKTVDAPILNTITAKELANSYRRTSQVFNVDPRQRPGRSLVPILENTFNQFAAKVEADQARFRESVRNLADSMNALQSVFSSLFSTLESGNPTLRAFVTSLGQGLRGQGSSIIGAGISEATGGLRKKLAEGALKGLGSLGASLLTGGLFYGAGALFGALGKKKPKEERIPDNIELIARNTSRSNDLLNKIINAGSNFIYAPASQLAYAGVSRAAFEDAGR